MPTAKDMITSWDRWNPSFFLHVDQHCCWCKMISTSAYQNNGHDKTENRHDAFSSGWWWWL